MEYDALEQLIEQQEQEEPYKWFMHNEPIRREDDEIFTDPDTGMRYQNWKIGMLRNDSNPRVMRVNLDPTPHVLIPNAKPFQGWYQSKSNPGHRPRPCLLPDALVDTPWGPKEIQKLKPGDIVFGYNEATGKYAATFVQGVSQQIKTEYLEIVLEDGRMLRLTPEHLVRTRNRGWVEAGALTTADDILDTSVQFNSGRQETLAGVYAIQSTSDGKMYIGSARDVVARVKKHLRILAKGQHSNFLLQSAYQCGEQFCIRFLEVCGKAEAFVREQYWMDKLQTRDRTFGYNLTDAGRTVPSLEGRARISAFRKGRKLEEIIGREKAAKRRKQLRQQTGSKNPNWGNRGALHPWYGKTWAQIIGPERAKQFAEVVSQRCKGRVVSSETKIKISKAHRGKNLSAEHRAKIAEGLNRHYQGGSRAN